MDAVGVVIAIIGFVLSILMIVKFFEIASNVDKIHKAQQSQKEALVNIQKWLNAIYKSSQPKEEKPAEGENQE